MIPFALALSLCAQTPTGAIEGTISDTTGAVIPGAKVTVVEKSTDRTINVSTNATGGFSVRNLLPGVYSVRVEYTGFSTKELRAVEVNSGSVVNGSLIMEVGQTGSVVEVQAQAISVDTARQTVDTIINTNEIRDLPLFSRNFLDFAALAPGVIVRDGTNIDPTKASTFRTVGIAGRSGTATRVQMDGIDVTDENVGTTVTNISQEAVNQFQLTRSSLDISTSLTSSGAINIITNSGGNDLHGTWFYDYYNQDMGARLQYQSTAAPFDRKRTGGTLGGRIIRNKFFWYGNAEKTWQTTQSVVVLPTFPQFNQTQGQALNVQYAFGRLDWNITPSSRMFYKFQHNDDISATGALSPQQNVNNTNLNAIGLDFAKGRSTHAIRFGYTNFNNHISSQELNQKFLRVSDVPIRLAVGALTYGPNTLAPQASYQDGVQLSYDGSYMLGKHTLRYGGSFNRLTLGGFAKFANWLRVTGTFDANTVANLDRQGIDSKDPLNFPLSTFTTGSPNGFPSLMGCHNQEHGCHINNRTAFFAGDSVKLARNFTLNLGLRFEYDSGYFNNDPTVKRLPVLETWGKGFSEFPNAPKLWNPSVGFAWDPKGNGKMSIRGGFYRAYEMNINNNIFFDEFVMLPPGIGADNNTIAKVVSPDGTPINIDGKHATGNYSDLIGQKLRDVLPTVVAVHNALRTAYANYKFDPTKGTPALTTLGGDNGGIIPGNAFKPPYSLQFNIGVERELRPGTVLAVDYIRNHGVGLPFLFPDFEQRRDASTLNVAAARTNINSVLLGQTMDQYIATHAASNISTFKVSGDDVFTGKTPDYLFMRFFQGGFTSYRALQVSLRGRASKVVVPWLKDSQYTLGYSLARSESTGGGARPEFETGTGDNHNFNSKQYFGPTTQDYRHVLSASQTLTVPGGIRLNSVWTFRTAAAASVSIPNLNVGSATSGSNGIFATDLNGDGGNGSTTPRNDALPGINTGQFGRSIGSLDELNAAITQFNQTYAGKITPAGRALVNAGLFTEAQLVALKGVVAPIALVPAGNPNPWHNVFTTDLRITRPVKIKEHYKISPFADIINLFNHAPMASYTGLGATFGALNFNYAGAAAGQQAPDLSSNRGRLNGLRQVQVGIRLDF